MIVRVLVCMGVASAVTAALTIWSGDVGEWIIRGLVWSAVFAAAHALLIGHRMRLGRRGEEPSEISER